MEAVEIQEQEQIAVLSFQPLGALASRDVIRETSLKISRQSYYWHIDKIQERPAIEGGQDFNDRIRPADMTDEQWDEHLQIPQLAMDLLENGQLSPLKGDVTSDGTFWLLGGHRRTMAIRWLLRNGYTEYKNGKPLSSVEVMTNPKEWSELERFIASYSDNNSLPLTHKENINKVRRFKEEFKLTHEVIADKMGQSRQWVDNMVKLIAQPEAVQNAIETGILTPTAALEMARTIKDPEKQEEIINDATAKGEKLTINAVKELAKEDKPNGTFESDDLDNGNQGQDSDDEDDDDDQVVENPTKVETQAAIDVEMQSRTTADKIKEHKPNNRTGDALDRIDFSEDKTQADLNLHESVAKLDKLSNKLKNLPSHLHQYINDYQADIRYIQGLLIETQALVKKAPRIGSNE